MAHDAVVSGKQAVRKILAQVKAEPSLADILLVRNSRLSVIPLTAEAYATILAMEG